MTLRLARSPEAPNKTTVQGSAGPVAPERLISTSLVPSQLSPIIPRHEQRPTLYLNVELLQISPQLLRVLVVDHVHAQAPWALEIQGPVVDKDAFLRGTLCNFEGYA